MSPRKNLLKDLPYETFFLKSDFLGKKKKKKSIIYCPTNFGGHTVGASLEVNAIYKIPARSAKLCILNCKIFTQTTQHRSMTWHSSRHRNSNLKPRTQTKESKHQQVKAVYSQWTQVPGVVHVP